MITPWSIHEAEIALYPAWRDGMPYRGPGTRLEVSPLMQCKSALSLSYTPRETESSGFNWTAAEPTAEGVWEISVSFQDGAYADDVSRLLSRQAPGGFHILVIRFIDDVTGQWSCFRFFYVTIGGDESSESSQIMGRSLRLRSTWMQEEVGSESPPSMQPVVLGEVDWVCGSQRITAMTYNPATRVWADLPRNAIGSGEKYVRITAAGDDVTLAAYLPYLSTPAPVAGVPTQKQIAWIETDMLRVGNADSLVHYGLKLEGLLTIQALGIAEPLMRFYAGWDRGLDSPYVVFRYLRRIYATIGDIVFAVPQITYSAPPASHDPAFQLSAPDGGMGLVLLPTGAWQTGSLYVSP